MLECGEQPSYNIWRFKGAEMRRARPRMRRRGHADSPRPRRCRPTPPRSLHPKPAAPPISPSSTPPHARSPLPFFPPLRAFLRVSASPRPELSHRTAHPLTPTFFPLSAPSSASPCLRVQNSPTPHRARSLTPTSFSRSPRPPPCLRASASGTLPPHRSPLPLFPLSASRTLPHRRAPAHAPFFPLSAPSSASPRLRARNSPTPPRLRVRNSATAAHHRPALL
jgi:hypothetical protein